MNRVTKLAKQKAQKAAWSKAIEEGCVVRSNDGLTFQEYETAQKAREVCAGMLNAEHQAEIVRKEQV